MWKIILAVVVSFAALGVTIASFFVNGYSGNTVAMLCVNIFWLLFVCIWAYLCCGEKNIAQVKNS